MMRRTARLATGLTSLALLVGVVFAVPYALVWTVGWPLPTVLPTLEQLRDVSQVGVADTTVVKTLAVIVWVAWAQLAVALGVETAATVRRRAAQTLPLLPGLQPLAARLVAGIALLAAVSTGPRPAVAVPLDTAVAAVPTAGPVDLQPTETPDHTGSARAEPTATETVVTGPRDSWWSLAERHLDDGLRWREIRDLNVGRTVGDGTLITADTDQLAGGWQLLVPASDTANTQVTTPADAAEAAATHWTVEPDEHFWSIAEQRLTDAWGRQPETHEITAYWRSLVNANHDRLLPPHDPDLIYPDQQLITPPVPDDPTAEPAGPRPAGPATTESRQDPAAPEPPPELADAPEAAAWPDADAAAHERESDASDTTASAGWRNVIEHNRPGEASPAPEASPEPNADVDERTGLGVPVGLTGGLAAAGLLAAGIVATIRRRRRTALQQRLPGLRLPTPLPDADEHLGRLQTAAVPEPVLEDLARLLASIPADAHPVLVTTDDHGDVTLLFDDTADVPEPSDPWQLVEDGTDGPVGWRARIGDRGPERSVGLPLLVTLGRAGQTTVHANVAAMRNLAVTGPDLQVRRRLRAMSLEVATSRIAIPVEVTVVGDDALASLDHVRHVQDPGDETAAALREVTDGVIVEDRTPRLLACHTGVHAPAITDDLVGIVGAVSANPPHDQTWTFNIDGENSGQLQLPDGGILELALPDVDPQLIDSELARLNADASPPDRDDDPDTSEDAAPKPRQHVEATEPAWCEVQLLGDVQVIRDGVPVEGLTPKTLEVLTYLVTHRGGVTKERLDDAVWGGVAARPGSQRLTAAITKLRSALGDGPDGRPLVPRRTDGSQQIRLSDHVGCDLDRAFAHLAIADDLPGDLHIAELAEALELIRGEPFQDLPVSWATEVTQRAIMELQDAAAAAAAAYREAGDFKAAADAIDRGLTLLDPRDVLYLERAELEKARGRSHRVPQIWKQLRQAHADDADEIAGQVTNPRPEIELAFQNLIVDG